MSSHSKRRAESEEVAHKKKPRKGEDEFNQDEGFDDGELDGDDVEDVVDLSNIVPSRRTRGKRVDYTKALAEADLVEDDGTESEGEGQKGKNGASTRPKTRSPERKQTANIEKDEDDEEEDEDDGDEDDGVDEEEDDFGGEDDEDEEE
ncbi:hypothetical protein BJV74DRAFT_889946 [Russula compacta]|nr:hypothetical protein BJV74DRAFT_889946 [Russula compacta]